MNPRVSPKLGHYQLIDLCVRDVRLDAPAQIRLTGKGRKTRLVPLLSHTVELLQAYLREHRLNRADRVEFPLFFNRDGECLSRSGVRYLLEKYTEQARKAGELLPDRITPHCLRHYLASRTM